MKNRFREHTDRNKGISNRLREERYQQFVRGWVNYFKLADMKVLLQRVDEWARRKICAVYWKQWKKRMSKVLSTVLINKIIAKLGYTSMLDYYLVVCEN